MASIHVAIGALRDIGFFGFGAGLFVLSFRLTNNMANKPAPARWRFFARRLFADCAGVGWLEQLMGAAVLRRNFAIGFAV